MDDRKIFKFAVKDQLLNSDISPDNVSLPLLSEFISQVSSFLRGSSRVNLGEVKTQIVEGSLAVAVHDETGVLDQAFEDYKTIKERHSVIGIDSIRAGIVLEWQESARSSNERSYSIGIEDSEDSLETLLIDSRSEFESVVEIWTPVEMYVYGRVFDIGGKNKSNVHIELENGNTLTAASKPEVLRNDDENRLYRKQLLRINAEQNLESGELRNEKLISFEDYNPVFDQDQYERMSSRISSAMSGVSDINEWVESLRGTSG